jgi:hypothetical protein
MTCLYGLQTLEACIIGGISMAGSKTVLLLAVLLCSCALLPTTLAQGLMGAPGADPMMGSKYCCVLPLIHS